MVFNHQPPMQRCTCGTEYFVVHDCPLKGSSSVADIPQGVPLLKKRIMDMAQLISELQRDKAAQQETITDLMLELAELREVKKGEYGVFS
jgi:hypothetical protein